MKDTQQLEFNFEETVQEIAQANSEGEIRDILSGLKMQNIRTLASTVRGGTLKSSRKAELIAMLAAYLWENFVKIDNETMPIEYRYGYRPVVDNPFTYARWKLHEEAKEQETAEATETEPTAPAKDFSMNATYTTAMLPAGNPETKAQRLALPLNKYLKGIQSRKEYSVPPQYRPDRLKVSIIPKHKPFTPEFPRKIRRHLNVRIIRNGNIISQYANLFRRRYPLSSPLHETFGTAHQHRPASILSCRAYRNLICIPVCT